MDQQQTVGMGREEKPRGQPENQRKDKQKEKFKDTSACLSTLALASHSIMDQQQTQWVTGRRSLRGNRAIFIVSGCTWMVPSREATACSKQIQLADPPSPSLGGHLKLQVAKKNKSGKFDKVNLSKTK